MGGIANNLAIGDSLKTFQIICLKKLQKKILFYRVSKCVCVVKAHYNSPKDLPVELKFCTRKYFRLFRFKFEDGLVRSIQAIFCRLVENSN